MEYREGMVVISSAGHDCGRWFVVTGADGRFLYLADGRERKLASPKRKNQKHVHKTSETIALEGLTDKGLRGALRALGQQHTEKAL